MTHSLVQLVANCTTLTYSCQQFLLTPLFPGQLPLLKDGPVWVAGASRILSHLSKKGHDGNASLSAEQIADSLA
jgi:hypothetical protein